MTEQMYARDYRLRNIFNGSILEEGLPRTDLQFEPGARASASAPAAGRRSPDVGGQGGGLCPHVEGGVLLPPRRHLDMRSPRRSRPSTTGSARAGRCWPRCIRWSTSRGSGGRSLAGQTGPQRRPDQPGAGGHRPPGDGLFVDLHGLPAPGSADRLLRSGSPGVRGVPRPVRAARRAARAQGRDAAELTAAVLRHRTRAAASSAAMPSLRRQWAATYAPHDDGERDPHGSSMRCSADAAGRRSVDISSDGRQRILVYLGTMKPNGITTSGAEPLGQHRPRTATTSQPSTCTPASGSDAQHRRRRPARAPLPARGRHERVQAPARAPRPAAADVGCRNGSSSRDRMPRGGNCSPRNGRDASARRASTTSSISAATGRCGISSCCRARRRAHSIWLHNDMYADARREVHGEQHLFQKLHSVFSTYRLFDNLVSVSRGTGPGQRWHDGASSRPRASFTYAHNTIDYGRGSWPPAATALPAGGRDSPQRDGGGEPNRARCRPRFGHRPSAGLSTEKNHERLITRVRRSPRRPSATRDSIVLGTGPLGRTPGAARRLAVPGRERRVGGIPAQPLSGDGGIGLFRAVQRPRGATHGDPGGAHPGAAGGDH